MLGYVLLVLDPVHNTITFCGRRPQQKERIIKFGLYNDTEMIFEQADVPTSGDVHLYSDPQSANSHHPILYADCEGLDGGEREPIGSRFRKKEKIHNGGRIGSFERNVQKVLHTSEREITWANTATRRSRNFAVSHMYPRLLYTFSDVVIFVLKNPRYVDFAVQYWTRLLKHPSE